MFDYAKQVITLNDIDDNTMENFNNQILAPYKISLDWKHVPFFITDKDAKFPMTIILAIELQVPDNLQYKFIHLESKMPELLNDYMEQYWSSLNKEEVINKFKNKLLEIIKSL